MGYYENSKHTSKKQVENNIKWPFIVMRMMHNLCSSIGKRRFTHLM